MKKHMACGRCGAQVNLKIDTVSCATCKLSHHIDFARAQVLMQAQIHGHTVDEHSFRSENGLLVFNIMTGATTRRVTSRAQSA